MIRYLFITLFALAAIESSAQSNLALGKIAEASSGTASLAVDGKTDTRWESAQSDDQWWSVDLATAHEFNLIQIVWEGAYAKSFRIEAANNADFTDARTIVEVSNKTLGGFPNTQNYEFDAVTARYIRFVGVERATTYGYSFWEFGVYKKTASELTVLTVSASANSSKVGNPVDLSFGGKDQYGNAFDVDAVTWTVSPADGGTIVNNEFTPLRIGEFSISAQKNAISSNVITIIGYEGANVASADKVIDKNPEASDNKALAFDGNEDGDPWLLRGELYANINNNELTPEQIAEKNNKNYTAYFTLDLGKSYNLYMVNICFEGACSAAYTIQTSADGTTWETAATKNHPDGIYAWKDCLFELPNSLGVRYVKFESTKAATIYGIKVREFTVYAIAVDGDLMKEPAINAQTGAYSLEGEINPTTKVFFENDNSLAYDLRTVTIPAALTIEAQNPNTMFIVTETQKTLLSGTRNLVVKDGNRYVSDNITLTDGYDVNTHLKIEAAEASYTRPSAIGYKTIVLPFNSSIPSGIRAYQLIDQTTNGILFQEVLQLASGTPYLLVGDGALNLSASNTTVDFSVNTNEGDAATMTATYEQTTAGNIGSNVYVLDDQNQFRKANPSAVIPAFRAYLTSVQALSKLMILFDETDGIEPLKGSSKIQGVSGVYSINGIRIPNLSGTTVLPAHKKGVYIVNGKKKIL